MSDPASNSPESTEPHERDPLEDALVGDAGPREPVVFEPPPEWSSPDHEPPQPPPHRTRLKHPSPAPNPLNVSRTLMFGWCAWLLGSWAVNLLIDAPRWVGSYGNMMPGDLYIPAVRGMLQSILLGLGVAWPMWRLSERTATAAPVGIQTAVDLASLLLVVQVVLWPLQYVVSWAFEQTALIAMALIVWSSAFGLCVWVGRRLDTPRARGGAMAACVAMLIGGWGLSVVWHEHEAAAWSPTYMLWTLCDRVTLAELNAATQRLMVIAGLVAAAWLLLRTTVARRAEI